MPRDVFRMAIVLLLIPTTYAWGADELPLPVRQVTLEEESPPEGASQIGVTTQLVEISLTKLEKETGIKLEWAVNEELPADKARAIVDALRKSSPGARQTLPATPEDFLDAVTKHNIAKVWTSAGEITATGQPNRLVVGGLESTESHDAVRRTLSSNQMSFFAIARDENRIAIDLRLRLSIHDEVLGPDDTWQPAPPLRQQEWQVATVQLAEEPTLWMGAVEEQIEAVEKTTWYGRRVVEQVNLIGTFLVVTPEIRTPREPRPAKGVDSSEE